MGPGGESLFLSNPSSALLVFMRAAFCCHRVLILSPNHQSDFTFCSSAHHEAPSGRPPGARKRLRYWLSSTPFQLFISYSRTFLAVPFSTPNPRPPEKQPRSTPTPSSPRPTPAPYQCCLTDRRLFTPEGSLHFFRESTVCSRETFVLSQRLACRMFIHLATPHLWRVASR